MKRRAVGRRHAAAAPRSAAIPRPSPPPPPSLALVRSPATDAELEDRLGFQLEAVTKQARREGEERRRGEGVQVAPPPRPTPPHPSSL